MPEKKDEDIQHLLPHYKSDVVRARRIVEYGYPAVAPVLSQLLVWLQDYNWPVAKVIAPFLATIGEPLLPEIRYILSTNDDVWKYWVLTLLVAKSRQMIEQLRPELTRITQSPTQGESTEELDTVATELLTSISILPDVKNRVVE